ncbi:MAG: phage tail sheath family protein [Vampirovibrionales bacterium]
MSAGGSGYTTAPTVTFAAPPTGGIQAEGVATVAAGVVTGITITKVGAGYSSAPTVTFSGGGGTGATATCTIGSVRNAVGAELLSVANRLRAFVLLDCPSTSDADAIAYRNDWDGLGRIMVVEPKVLVDRGNTAPDAEPASSVWAGITAKTDYEQGFWCSPSNKDIAGIVGIARPMDFAMDDPACRANTLNSQQISVIVRKRGFSTWGNRTTSSDSKWQFLAERRTADMINDSIQAGMLTFVDRPISKAMIQDVLESINEYLRSLKSQGAILDGNAWIEDELNPIGQLANGQVVFSFDFKSSPPAERITIRSAVNNGYLEELI